MASATYIRKRQERNSRRGKYGNEVKRRKMRERGADLEVAGWMKTGGNLGDHLIEILACDDPEHVWLRVDGGIRRPRTPAGVRRVVADWIWRVG